MPGGLRTRHVRPIWNRTTNAALQGGEGCVGKVRGAPPMRVGHWRQVRRLVAGDIRFGVGRRTPQRESSLGFVSGAHAAKVLSMNSHATKNAFFMSSTKLPSGPPLHPTTSTTGPSQLPLPRPLPPAPPTSTPATNSTQSCYLTRPSLATQLRCYSPPRLATSQPSLATSPPSRATSPPSLATQLRGSSPPSPATSPPRHKSRSGQ